MRLTLRTLLAYLDDTLDPAEARQIGLKVAESEVARETIDRIKKTIRRRSLGVPPVTGPDKADPNAVAEYLDNDLSESRINEIEDQALNSDVHLAEIASCHQLLTLILSEPAMVPPTSRQRMYNLVKGPEADPARRVPRVQPATIALDESEGEDWDGHPLVSRRGGRKRLIIAGCVALLFGLATWQAMTQSQKPTAPTVPDKQVADASNKHPDALENTKSPPDQPAKTAENKTAPAKTGDEKTEPAKSGEDKSKSHPEQPPTPDKDKPQDPPPVDPPAPSVDPKQAELAAARKPSSDRTEVGRWMSPNSVVLQMPHDAAPWERVTASGPIFGAGRLMSLPAVVNEIRLNDAVNITLWGATPEHQVAVAESVVTPYVPPAGFAADLRLELGRIYLQASKPAGARVRLRLGNEVFDLTLPDDKAIVLAQIGGYVDGEPYVKDANTRPPRPFEGFVGVTSGKIAIRVNLASEAEMTAVPGKAAWEWTAAKGPATAATQIDKVVANWAKVPTIMGQGRDQYVAMDERAKRWSRSVSTEPKKDIGIAIAEILTDNTLASLRLSLYCHTAMGNLAVLLDALEDETNFEARYVAVFCLRRWLGHAADRDDKLMEAMVSGKKYTPVQAETALMLWHGLPEPGRREAKNVNFVIDALNNERLGVRELAAMRVFELDADAKEVKYATTDHPEARARAVQEWKRRFPIDGPPAKPLPQQ